MEIKKFLIGDFKIYDNTQKKGGQAIVVKGQHISHGDVAIKTYHMKDCDKEATLLMQSANHQNIVQLIGILIDEQSQYIGYIMQYMLTGSLDEIIHDKNQKHDNIYNNEQINKWIIQICCGLSYLHSKEIIHRDIKPSKQGTPYYMAPEIIQSKPYNISADIYSLAITIWEISHRRIPFDHSPVALYKLFDRIVRGERPELKNNLSQETSTFLKRCWDDDVSLRPTVNDVLEFSKTIGFKLILSSGNTIEFEKHALLLVGGDDGKGGYTLLVLPNNEEHWKELNIKLPYKSYGAEFLNNNLYIFGGEHLKRKRNSPTYKLSCNIELSNSTGLQWEEMVDMKVKRLNISNSSVVLKNLIWVCGGVNEIEWLQSVEMYDPITNKWKYMREMNECRERAAATVINEKIFCCGGFDGEKELKSLECYDFYSDLWTLICDIPEPIAGHGAVAIDENLVVIGGWATEGYLNTVWVLDTTNNDIKWVAKPHMSMLRYDFSAVNIDGKIFICGGKSYQLEEYVIVDDVEILEREVWKKGPKLTTPRRLAPAVAIPVNFAKNLIQHDATFFDNLNEKETVILVNGKDHKNNVLILQNNGENWKELTLKLPCTVENHAVQFLNNHLYIFGGRQNREALNSTYKLIYNIEANNYIDLKWERKADMNQKRYDIANSSVILNNQIWVCGGSKGNYVDLNSVEMYDPGTNEWKYMKEMNEYRKGAAAAVVNGNIFCCGGSNGQMYLNSAESYDPSSDVWTLICTMPKAKREFGAVAMGETLMVIGGWDAYGALNTVWVLDTTDKDATWIKQSDISIPRFGFSVTKIDNRIIVCGGKCGQSYNASLLDDVKVLDGGVWRNGPRLPTPQSVSEGPTTIISMDVADYLIRGSTSTMKISTEKETVLLLGGIDGKGRRSLFILENNGDNWKELITRLPHSLWDHGAQFAHNSLYIFGGDTSNMRSLNVTYKLSKSSQWEKVENMNEGRSNISNSSVILNNQIWVCGGKNKKEDDLKSVEMYDPVTDKWKYMREMNECRRRAAAAVVNEKIFCSGGWKRNFGGLNTTECYDPLSDVWTLVSDMPGPDEVQGAAGICETLIVIGGRTDRREFRGVGILDTADKNAKWLEKPSMLTVRRHYSVVKIDNIIIVCGGDWQDEKLCSETVDDVEIFDGENWKNGPKLITPRSHAAAVVIPIDFAQHIN